MPTCWSGWINSLRKRLSKPKRHEARLAPGSADRFQRLYTFLRERDPRAAERAIRAIQLGAQRLLEFPHLGRRIDDETERREVSVPFGAGAYVLRYRMHDETIVVLRVWHS